MCAVVGGSGSLPLRADLLLEDVGPGRERLRPVREQVLALLVRCLIHMRAESTPGSRCARWPLRNSPSWRGHSCARSPMYAAHALEHLRQRRVLEHRVVAAPRSPARIIDDSSGCGGRWSLPFISSTYGVVASGSRSSRTAWMRASSAFVFGGSVAAMP